VSATAALDQDEVRAAVRDYARDADAIGRLRSEADGRGRAEPAASDRAAWRTLCEGLGVPALAVPEKLDGLGAGESSVTVALEELGASLEPAPVWSGIALARALAAADAREALDLVLAGAVLPAFALPGAGPGAGPDVRLSADGRVDGVARLVPDGPGCEMLLLLAERDGRDVLALVGADGLDGAPRTPRPGTDLVRLYADIDLGGARAQVLVTDPDQVRRLCDLAELGAAAELLGTARACLERTVEYLQLREQFGRLIGSFQALQHTCARVAVGLEQAWALLDRALRLDELGDGGARHALCPLVVGTAREVAVHAADAMVHLHGGIGFTWEHDAHLYFRRARSAATLRGTPDRYFAEAVTRGCSELVHQP
jgi:alkylation response protein AidB-like acyl-CoA dehydrogenase